LSKATRACRLAMRHAENYETWREAAAELDRLEGRDQWQHEEASEDYDWQLIRSRLRELRRYRAHGQARHLLHHLRQGLHWNLGNIGNPALYARLRTGTKKLIQDYLDEVVAALEFLVTAPVPGLSQAERLRFFRETAQSYGRSALMLSGGATLGLFHVGVVKALVLQDLLPQVISGSSAGAVVAATLGTRTPQELRELLDPQQAYYDFWKPLPLREMWKRGVAMDQRQLRRAIAANVRDWTFEESYRRSGRIVNITVSPAGSNQPPRLLNYLTFPYLFLREAVLASSAVPLLFEPVLLMTRDVEGRRVPYLPSLRWTDGSLKSDLPMLRLRRLHNVNHFIVSQTNPHIIPFLGGGLARPSLAGAARDYVYSTVRESARYLIGIGRLSLPVPRLRQTLDYASWILEQDYRGNITVHPKVTVWRYAHVAANPQLDAVRRFIREGERATWPRLAMIKNQTAIARTLERCMQRLEARAQEAFGDAALRDAALAAAPERAGTAPALHLVSKR
jgi:TAG lipase/steryl ester hydrolase/phospholipase A2/LPA acyltransferase